MPTHPHTHSPTRSQVDTEVLEIEGVRVAVGGIAPDPTLPAGADPLEGVEWQPDADVSVLMVHGSLQGHAFPGAPEPFIQKRSVERLGIDCLLVGHVHRYATFRWGRTAVIVPGATERMTFGEMDGRPGFVCLEVTPGEPPEITHVSVDPHPRRQVIIQSADLEAEDPAAELMARIEDACDRETLLRVSLEGPITRHRYHDLRLRDVAEFGAARCFFLDLDTTGLYVEDDLPRGVVARTGRLSPREELIRYGEEVREAAPAEERDLVDEAMRVILGEYE